MAYPLAKKNAHEMRKNGISIRDISHMLKINKSTVSYWCRDIEISKKQREKLILKQKTASVKALLRNAEIKRKNRIEETLRLKNLGREMVGNISKRDFFCIGIGLYCGEGYKEANDELGFTNSDVRIILFIMKWFEMIFGIKRDDFIFRLSINISHIERERDVLKFWIDTLGVSEGQFSKTSFIKTKKKKMYKNGNEYYGTLRIKVRKSTSIKRKIMGSIERVLSS